MAHQNTQSPKATAQNGVTPSREPHQDDLADRAGARPEPRSYAATSYADASLAPPAAGEIADAMDEGEALGEAGLQQGSTHANRPVRTEAARGQGQKTTEANRKAARTGSADQGTH